METSKWIEKAKNKFKNRWDYSKVEYKDNESKVCIICPEHGEFWQTPHAHMRGQIGCKKCHYKNVAKKQSKNKEKFIFDANKIHKNKYDYSKVEYINARTKVNINLS